MVKGGAFRCAVPLVDQQELNEVLEAVQKKTNKEFLDFGIYDRLTRTQAASASGLYLNRVLLKSLVAFCPGAETQHHQLKNAILQFPLLNDGQLKNTLWAAQKSERLGTMLCHSRRIARDQLRLRQCLCKATDNETQCVRELVRSISTGDVSESELAVESGTSRTLRVHASDASSALTLDSDGFPSVLTDVESKDVRKGREDCDTVFYDVRRPDASKPATSWESPSRAHSSTRLTQLLLRQPCKQLRRSLPVRSKGLLPVKGRLPTITRRTRSRRQRRKTTTARGAEDDEEKTKRKKDNKKNHRGGKPTGPPRCKTNIPGSSENPPSDR